MSQDDQPLMLLQRYVNKAQGRLIAQIALVLVALSLWFGLFYYRYSEHLWLMSGIFTVLLVTLVVRPLFKRLRLYNRVNMAEHFNRHLPELEESCQLLLCEPGSLSLLPSLQKNKIAGVFENLHRDGELTKVLPKPNVLPAVLLLFCGGLLYFALMQLSVEHQMINTSARVDKDKPLLLEKLRIEVFPPRYTKLKPQQYSSNDIEVVQGAKVRWHLRFADKDKRYHLQFGDESIALQYQRDRDIFTTDKIIEHTSLYRITSDGQSLPGVYSIAVIKDQRPRVRLVVPSETQVEITGNDTQLAIQALVIEDYGLTETHIMASVAKGSGEAVKFRDEIFAFDQAQTTELGLMLFKTLDLKALGMEASDEAYFTVVATDNKPSSPQVGRSHTVIVRWPQPTEELAATAGLTVQFVPEYFRSQRQIIMETQQLIADKAGMDKNKIDALSQSLGQSQGDLKWRYGQYLGDESESAETSNIPMSGLGDEHHHDHHQEEHAEPESKFDMATSAEQIIAEFGHFHEDIHVDYQTTASPQFMMKKAVGFMWQAQTQLLLSEPEKALPYELQAYKYLKLAKQAERIYVKRLGFEPPPVSTENRLTGELDGVKSYTLESQAKGQNEQADEIFRRAYSLLSQLSLGKALSQAHREQLIQTKSQLTQMADARPTLIRYAATVERILTFNSATLKNCDNCVAELKQKLWQLITMEVGRPVAGQQNYLNSDEAVKDYLQVLQSVQGGS